jgi:hypothetical protein
MPKDLLIGEHVRQHRRAMRLARGGLTALAVLLVVADGPWDTIGLRMTSR